VNIELAQQVSKIFLEADVPLHLWGPAGVGKSTYMEDLIAEMGYHLEDPAFRIPKTVRLKSSKV
jgi:MoxR-like ATPase